MRREEEWGACAACGARTARARGGLGRGGEGERERGDGGDHHLLEALEQVARRLLRDHVVVALERAVGEVRVEDLRQPRRLEVPVAAARLGGRAR